jgi:putative FmdB family regulatory protein
MPIYEYACRQCEHTLDALQKLSDDPLLDCPACGKPALRKRISAPRFRLKGEGWYETDFKKDNQRNVLKGDVEPAKADKTDSKADAKAPAEKASDTKTPDTKPATKVKTKSETE